MKKIYLITIFVLMSIGGYCQQGEWTWMNGADTADSPGHYGTQGVFAAANTPPGLYEACEWTDLQGNFWLFGGFYNDTTSAAGDHCDLWEFKPSINQWAWIKGPGVGGISGIYGTQGIPSPTNNPGGRGWGVATWVDLSGDLWLMGGDGIDINGNESDLNDLWRYNIASNEWTWMAGPDTSNGIGNYGTILVSAPTNYPPARWETSVSWVDNSGNLWYFGGFRVIGPNFVHLNDLWRYDISINQWAWMKGSNGGDQHSVYGIKGIPDSANHPSGRWCYAKWKESNGNFWLFGGSDSSGGKNDLWRYNPNTNMWTWMSGTNLVGDSGRSGTQCIGDTMNAPSALRFENRACWTRPCDNFVFWGGGNGSTFNNGLNDLWNYCVATNKWTWMSGSVIPNQIGNYGVKTISSPTNSPHGRLGSVGWKDNSGNLWFFGGYLSWNDMWRFVPDSTCPIISGIDNVTSSFIVDTLQGCKPLYVHFTNTSTNATSYHWEFTGGGTSDSISPTRSFGQSGTYTATLIAYDSTACGVFTDTSSQTFFYTVFIPPAQPHIIQNGDTLTIANYTTGLQWLNYSIPMPGDTNSVLIVTHTGCYQAIETDIHGCTDKSDVICINFTSIPTISDNHGISIYPNPNDGTFTLSIHSPMSIENYQLSIENVLGQEIYKQIVSGTDNIIDVSMWSEGIYFYEVRSMNEIMRGKFVKE
jgi:N-acetylneuraminic acid mutarotase